MALNLNVDYEGFSLNSVVGQAINPQNSYFKASLSSGIITPSGALSAPAQDTLNALAGRPPAKTVAGSKLPSSTGRAVPALSPMTRNILLAVGAVVVVYLLTK